MWPEPTKTTLLELLNSELIGKIITIYANYPLSVKTKGLIYIATYQENDYSDTLTLFLKDCKTNLNEYQKNDNININFDTFQINIDKINNKVTQELTLSSTLPEWIPFKIQQLMWRKQYGNDRFTCSQFTFENLAKINN